MKITINLPDHDMLERVQFQLPTALVHLQTNTPTFVDPMAMHKRVHLAQLVGQTSNNDLLGTVYSLLLAILPTCIISYTASYYYVLFVALSIFYCRHIHTLH